nr:sterol desaturase family protein [Lewinella sp. JB7]
MVVVESINDGIRTITGGFDLQASNPLQHWPLWAVLLTGFVVRDFIQWWIHRLLHRVDFLWKFHQVHHSVREMGFAAHLRFHWMEIVVYRSIEYLPLALLGIGLYDFFIIHLFGLAWGHYNHANFRLPHWVSGGIVGALTGLAIGSGSFDIDLLARTGPWTTIAGGALGFATGAAVLRPLMPYLFNSPEMHLWHHARHLPEDRRYGANFGLTLSVWDYLFGTDYVPEKSGTIALGFPGVESFPSGFIQQELVGFASNDRKGNAGSGDRSAAASISDRSSRVPATSSENS